MYVAFSAPHARDRLRFALCLFRLPLPAKTQTCATKPAKHPNSAVLVRRQRACQLHALAYNLGNFLRTLATPEPIKDWSLTSLKDKLIKIGAKVVCHGCYVAFQMAEVAITRQIFREILRLIAELRPPPPLALA